MVKDTLNPFDNKERLFNLGTGKAAEIGTEQFLLNINKLGSVASERFINECVDDSSRFGSPVKA